MVDHVGKEFSSVVATPPCSPPLLITEILMFDAIWPAVTSNLVGKCVFFYAEVAAVYFCYLLRVR